MGNLKHFARLLSLTVALLVFGIVGFAQFHVSAQTPSIVGTWLMNVAESDGGEAPFMALQTFHSDGTFTETSSLLGMGGEGPAHGVWSGSGNDYLLTFELFIFEEDGASAGRVRVRVSITLNGDELIGKTAVDLITPSGEEQLGIDTGTFTGTRLQVMGVE